jgi:hypothetical protein
VPPEVVPCTDKPIAAPEDTGNVTWNGNPGEFNVESTPFDFKMIFDTWPDPVSFTSYLTVPTALAEITGSAKSHVWVPPLELFDLEQEKSTSAVPASINRITDFTV